MSTQTTAWALYAISDYARAYAGDGIEAGLQASGKSYGISTRRCMAEQEVPVPAKATGTLPLKLENKGRAPLHVILSTTAIPKVGEETAAANGISLKLAYEDEQGKPLPLDSLRSGRNFRAVVTVTNTGNAPARDLALAHKIPSAWEIRQLRLQQDEDVYPAGIRYQDIRDDRVHTFMDLDAGSSITVSIPLTVVYTGHFYLPAVSCEAMYDSRISALLPGRWIDVR